MNTNILQTLASNSPPSSSIPIPLKRTTTATTNTYHGRPIRRRPISSTGGSSSNAGSNDAPRPVPPPITPPDTVDIRFRRGSRRQRQRREGGEREKQPLKTQASADNITTPKKWEDMSLREKAMDLYMGEKGLLFWLNKFAYASIFIMIGAWILFRFVGPSLNLYQLDAPPLSPSDVFRGS